MQGTYLDCLQALVGEKDWNSSLQKSHIRVQKVKRGKRESLSSVKSSGRNRLFWD